ncbi:2Fe-2S iron-sulfur cluster-binding protein [Tumidithrix elongata RA019]|uniref:2Fe-2S iron-sulfur cluster-binding protein n=1 Tax=Tumidithrix elongata BACA0141 TaxID=2716417 RepID=A0AAW9Q2D6_9CYAN|nr:2Fe-2S iron-sulfur cluster-binding protein [Tumidithrix elongata RA019]
MIKQKVRHTVSILDRSTGKRYEADINSDRYILEALEEQGVDLPFACRNGACTACAMRVISGQLDQSEAMGLSQALKQKGYALICSSYACSDLELETQDEDEVYQIQFGQYFPKQKRPWFSFALPLDHD